MPSELKAIPTRYKGHHFRSRLEARYAVFLDHLGVQWQYEPEGFELPSGYYLPDFFLPKLGRGTWLEIKPHGIGSYFGYCVDWSAGGTEEQCLSDARLNEFGEAVSERGQDLFVAYGIPSSEYFEDIAQYTTEGMLESLYDPHQWCTCGCGRTVDIVYDGRGDRIRCPHGCAKSSHGDKGYSHDHPLIVRAAEAARSARFEHGESGAT